jgi:hypothetical protein
MQSDDAQTPDSPPNSGDPLVFQMDTSFDVGPLSLVACTDMELEHTTEKHIDPYWVANWIIRTD